MVNREEYLNKLWSWKDEPIIKVITGIRRSGKSTLLKIFQNKLKENGVTDDQIISINFEELENQELLDYQKLYEHVKSKLHKTKRTYIFLDEIQKVENFEKMVDSLYVKDNVDVYITGSNAYMLSGDLATLLSGRYVEISILPLSFKEYYEINQNQQKEEAFASFLNNGGMPYVATMEKTEEKVSLYLEGIYNTIVLKDIEERQARKSFINERKINDISLLKQISRYLADVIGNPVSIKGITNYICSNNRKVSDNTISSYVSALVEAFIFYPAFRFNIQGKEHLTSNSKYYIVDLGLRRHLISKKNYDLGFSLENVVFLELIRRGYKVSIGKIGNLEVDFVATKNGVTQYFQVSASILDKSTFDREMKPLKAITDNYNKTILTLDKFSLGNFDGIEVVNIIDWLLA